MKTTFLFMSKVSEREICSGTYKLEGEITLINNHNISL